MRNKPISYFALGGLAAYIGWFLHGDAETYIMTGIATFAIVYLLDNSVRDA